MGRKTQITYPVPFGSGEWHPFIDSIAYPPYCVGQHYLIKKKESTPSFVLVR